MINHLHLIFRSAGKQKTELLIGDFKRFTSKAIVKAIIGNLAEGMYSSAADYAWEKVILGDVIVIW